MNPFDHFVKRELRCPAYLRFVDDFLLFSDDGQTLLDWKKAIERRLARLRLTIHSGAHSRPTTEGVPFLGFVLYRQRRRLKRRKGIYYRRRLMQLVENYADGIISLDQLTASVQGWVNHVRYGNTVGLRKAMLSNIVIPPPRN